MLERQHDVMALIMLALDYCLLPLSSYCLPAMG